MKKTQCGTRAWAAVLAGVAAAVVLPGCALIPVPVTRAPAAQTITLPQNWSAAQSQWFHHASQGTATLPVDYEWFLALEQPGATASERPLFSDPAYLRSWGFIDLPGSPDGLPVGFARTEKFVDPSESGPPRQRNAIGFTCAACHTGQFTYRGTRVVVEGGASQAHVTGMAEALGLAVLETTQGALTFDRFARRLLKDRDSSAARSELLEQLQQAEKKVARLALLTKAKDKGSVPADRNVPEGYGRLDALNRIGNQVFALDTGRNANFAATNAPVSYPAIWNTSWFNWVQYDGSIMQPMVRNAGEALGVAAGVTYGKDTSKAYKSSVDIKNLHAIETTIAGTTPPLPAKAFSGLASPRWPAELLGTPAPERVARGRALYDQLCAGCHLPPVGSDGFWSAQHWAKLPQSQHSYLKLPIIPVDEIGTDPAQAAVLATRTVDTTDMGVNARVATPAAGGCAPQAQPVTDGPAVPFPLALGAVVQQVIDVAYKELQIPPAQQPAYDGDRPNCLQAGAGYRARPLNGAWATGPYLHNGSVLTLYELLSPVAERRPVIHLGNLEFDNVRVGLLDGDKLENATRVDTSTPGNSNAGHEFSGDGKKSKGIIGRLLSPAERADIVEFLKTL